VKYELSEESLKTHIQWHLRIQGKIFYFRSVFIVGVKYELSEESLKTHIQWYLRNLGNIC
jgi:hypothetical protein